MSIQINRFFGTVITTLLIGLWAGCQHEPTPNVAGTRDPFAETSASSTGLADQANMQRLTITSTYAMEKIVIEFSTETDFARAYGVNNAQPLASGSVLEFTAGNPADLILQLDASGETVLALVFGGAYISNHVARTHLPDGTIVPNNPDVVYQDATEDIIGLWQRLRQINKSFRIELLEVP
ncbi:MAG: hypothetical protein LAT79_14380 [Kiritimatiellae bacterium]|nr:hypothetical protein [Kiritimatiellia bacterium]